MSSAGVSQNDAKLESPTLNSFRVDSRHKNLDYPNREMFGARSPHSWEGPTDPRCTSLAKEGVENPPSAPLPRSPPPVENDFFLSPEFTPHEKWSVFLPGGRRRGLGALETRRALERNIVPTFKLSAFFCRRREMLNR